MTTTMRSVRKRREVAPAVLRLLRPVYRYSYSRDAYVLRAIGRSRGPVLRSRAPAPPAPEATAEPDEAQGPD